MQVFISHSHRDDAIVNRIAKDLTSRGVQVWLDTHQIALGDQLADRLSQGIEESDGILIILSRNVDQSRYVTLEIAFAIAAQRKNPSKRVIPVLVDKQAEVPFFLRDVLYCDLSSEDKYNRNLDSLVLTLSRPPLNQSEVAKRDNRKIEAIQTEIELLEQETKAFEKAAKLREQRVFLFINLAIAIAVTTVVFVLWAFGMFKPADTSQNGKWWNNFIPGVISGVLCSIIAAGITRILKKRSVRKEVDNGNR